MQHVSGVDSLASDVVWLEEPAARPADPVEPVRFTIGTLAKQFGVTLRALRFYENKGLLAPRREGTTRLYSDADCQRLALILKGKKLGFSLAEIRQMVETSGGRADTEALKLSREKCLEQIGLLEKQRAGIEEALDELRQIHRSLSLRMVEAGSGRR